MATDHLKSPSPGTTATKIHRPRPEGSLLVLHRDTADHRWGVWDVEGLGLTHLEARSNMEVENGGRKWGDLKWILGQGQSLVILGILGIKMGEMLQIFMIHVRLFICFLGGWNGMNCLGVQKICMCRLDSIDVFLFSFWIYMKWHYDLLNGTRVDLYSTRDFSWITWGCIPGITPGCPCDTPLDG